MTTLKLSKGDKIRPVDRRDCYFVVFDKFSDRRRGSKYGLWGNYVGIVDKYVNDERVGKRFVKICPCDDNIGTDYLIKEKDFVMDHPFLEKVIDVFEASLEMFDRSEKTPLKAREVKVLVSEKQYIGGETLEEYIRSNPDLSEEEKYKMMRQILLAVQFYSHAAGKDDPYVHRDLSWGNIMVLKEKHRIVVIDYDFAHVSTRNGKSKIYNPRCVGGTPGFAAPECYREERTSTRMDIYSVGRLFCYILTGIEYYTDKELADREIPGMPYYCSNPALGYEFNLSMMLRRWEEEGLRLKRDILESCREDAKYFFEKEEKEKDFDERMLFHLQARQAEKDEKDLEKEVIYIENNLATIQSNVAYYSSKADLCRIIRRMVADPMDKEKYQDADYILRDFGDYISKRYKDDPEMEQYIYDEPCLLRVSENGPKVTVSVRDPIDANVSHEIKNEDAWEYKYQEKKAIMLFINTEGKISYYPYIDMERMDSRSGYEIDRETNLRFHLGGRIVNLEIKVRKNEKE